VKKRVVVAVLSIACVAMLSSCQGKNNKELYAGADGDYQYNSLEYSDRKVSNLRSEDFGFKLPLSLEEVGSCAPMWNWEISMTDFKGNNLDVSEEEKKSLWGIEITPEPNSSISEEPTSENESSSSEDQSNETTSSSSDVMEESVVEVRLFGNSEDFNSLINSDVVLKSGQTYTLKPTYMKSTVEDSTQEDGTTSSSSEASASSEAVDSSSVVEEEYTKRYISSIKVVNFSSEDKSIKDCVSLNWYVVNLTDIANYFNLDLEDEDADDLNVIFTDLNDTFGSPTVMWLENPTKDSYAEGSRVVLYGYEFPEYTLAVLSDEDSDGVKDLSVSYIPKSCWLSGDENADGIKDLCNGKYSYVDKTVVTVPDVTSSSSEEGSYSESSSDESSFDESSATTDSVE
jgi:hypothetical protein